MAFVIITTNVLCSSAAPLYEYVELSGDELNIFLQDLGSQWTNEAHILITGNNTSSSSGIGFYDFNGTNVESYPNQTQTEYPINVSLDYVGNSWVSRKGYTYPLRTRLPGKNQLTTQGYRYTIELPFTAAFDESCYINFDVYRESNLSTFSNCYIYGGEFTQSLTPSSPVLVSSSTDSALSASSSISFNSYKSSFSWIPDAEYTDVIWSLGVYSVDKKNSDSSYFGMVGIHFTSIKMKVSKGDADLIEQYLKDIRDGTPEQLEQAAQIKERLNGASSSLVDTGNKLETPTADPSAIDNILDVDYSVNVHNDSITSFFSIFWTNQYVILIMSFVSVCMLVKLILTGANS